MEIKRTNFLNIHALIKAQREGKLAEQLELQRNLQPYELSTEEYCAELLRIRENAEDPGISGEDVKRIEFLANY